MVDTHGQTIASGNIGLLRCRGPGVATGFCNEVGEISNESFKDGWYYPGEIARFDPNGFLHIVGRASDTILRAGINIYPVEIEDVLQRHPAVLEAAVLGAPSLEYGEEVVAFVRLRVSTSSRELLETCRRYLTAYKVPCQIVPIDEFPRNPAGKVLKSELLRLLREGPPTSVRPGDAVRRPV